MDARTLAKEIKTLRKNAGLTLVQLSSRTGIPARSLTRMEAGDPSAPIGRVMTVLASLGATLSVAPTLRPTLDQLAATYDER